MRFTVLLLMVLISACTSKKQDTDKKVFYYNESSDISSLDPAFARNLEEMWAVNQLFDGLVEIGNDMEIKPLIAESWNISDSGKTYTFTLRDNVYFHENELFNSGDNTRSVTADDFVFSWNRILDPNLASPGKWVFNNVDLDRNGGFYATDDQTLVVHLKEPFTPFLGMLSMQYFNVVPKEIVDELMNNFRIKPIGTGPFKFAFWYDQIAMVFHKNELFWEKDNEGNELPYLDAIKIDFVKDMNSEYLGLLKGDYDFMSGIDASFKDELLDQNGELKEKYTDRIRFQKIPFIKTDYLGILVDENIDIAIDSPLQDKLIRQAINYAINREEMVRYLRNNSVFPAGHGFIPKGLPSYDDSLDYGFDYNPDKARELVAQAGYIDGKKMETIVLATTKDYVDLCEYIQHNLQEVGIPVQVDVLLPSAHREQVSNSKITFFRKSWLADYVDAENFMSLFYSSNFCPNGPNYTHFYNEEFDSLFEMARSETDIDLRKLMYAKMDSIVMDESPVIPLFYDQVSHFVSNDMIDFETNPFNLLDLKETKKK